MEWHILRKTTTQVYVSYEHADATTLFAENIAARVDDPFDVSVDLNKNLRTRNKAENTYHDARDLAGGTIGTLKMLQINDDQVYQRIERRIGRLKPAPKTVRLRVQLEGAHWFSVRLEAPDAYTLLFHVVGRLDADDCEHRSTTERRPHRS